MNDLASPFDFFMPSLLRLMYSINLFSSSVRGIISSHASLYFVYVTNALLGCVIMYSAGGFLLGRRQNGLPGNVIYWWESKHVF